MIVERIGAATLICADARDALPSLEAPAQACVSDPPYGLTIRGETWDREVPGAELWTLVRGAIAPGAHVAAFAHARTYHHMAVALEAARMEIRDQLVWLYGSGMAKAHSVSRAIDRMPDGDDPPDVRLRRVTGWIRAQRDRVGLSNRAIDAHFGHNGMAGHWTTPASQPAIPTVEQFAELLALFGMTAGDVPAGIVDDMAASRRREPGAAWREAKRIVHKRSAPAMRWGGGRAEAGDAREPNSAAARQWAGWKTALAPAHEPIALARRPLAASSVARNVLAHGAGALNIDACRAAGGRFASNALHDGSAAVDRAIAEGANYYYCAKPSLAERNAGLGGGRNAHPTVKPVRLMRWLCRLMTPPGGVVLDTFMGSGSTGVAALAEGFGFVGVERDRDSFDTACARLRHAAAQPRLELDTPPASSGAGAPMLFEALP